MPKISSTIIARLIASSLFVAVMAGGWDAWWHGAVGRETIFEPPHLLLYAAVTVAILGGLYGWYTTREKLWRNLAIILAIVPISAPFDEIWHRIFGMENVASPAIVWSPPHLALIFSVTISAILLFPILRKDKDIHAARLLGSMLLAAIASLLFFLGLPITPTGPHELLGFWGAGFLAAAFAGILVLARRVIPGFAPATITAFALVVLNTVSFHSGRIAPGLVLPPHDHPPSWLVVFALLVPALVLDLFPRLPAWLAGGVTGLLWGGLLFGFSSPFFLPQFQYPTTDSLIAALSSLLGGLAIGAFLYLVPIGKR